MKKVAWYFIILTLVASTYWRYEYLKAKPDVRIVKAATTRYIAQTAGTFTGGSACNGQTAISATTFNSVTNSPGDIDYLCGTITGSTGGNIITVLGSGTSSNPINLIFDTGASLSAPYCNSFTNNSGCLVISTLSSAQSYITVNGGIPCGWVNGSGAQPACNGTIVNTNSGTGLTTNTATTAINMTNCTGCVVENVGIYNLYVQSGGDTNANPQYENCIYYSGSNNSIHNNRMHDVGWCLFYGMQNGDTNNQVYNNEIYNTPHPMFFATSAAGTTGATNHFIYSNHFHDYINWETSGCVYHIEGIHASGPNSAPFPSFTNLNIYNNYFGPNEGTCLYAEVFFSNNGTATLGGYINQSNVFNNIFEHNVTGVSDYAQVITGNGNTAYNNTMICDGGSSSNSVALFWGDISQNSGYTYTFKNNATQGCYTMVDNDSIGSEDSSGATITADYNVYSDCVASTGQCLYAFYPGGANTWAQYISNTVGGGQEQHSTATAIGGTCCGGTLGLSASPNFVPQTGSATIAAGTNLYSICNGQPNPGIGALCFDSLGNSRPNTGNWTAGAIGAGGSPAPPTGLTAKSNIGTQFQQ